MKNRQNFLKFLKIAANETLFQRLVTALATASQQGEKLSEVTQNFDIHSVHPIHKSYPPIPRAWNLNFLSKTRRFTWENSKEYLEIRSSGERIQTSRNSENSAKLIKIQIPEKLRNTANFVKNIHSEKFQKCPRIHNFSWEN